MEMSVCLPESDNFRNEESLFEEKEDTGDNNNFETKQEETKQDKEQTRRKSRERQTSQRSKSRPTTRGSAGKSTGRKSNARPSVSRDSRYSTDMESYQKRRGNVFGDTPADDHLAGSVGENAGSKTETVRETERATATGERAHEEEVQKWRTETTKDGRIIVFQWSEETTQQGDTYIGETVNGLYQGFGKMYYANGDKYVGQWKEGKFHHYGELMKGEFIEFGRRIVGRSYKVGFS